MKRLIVLLTFSFLSHSAFSQNEETSNKTEIKQILTTFMDCLVKKDSVKFYSLFHNEPTVWVGVFKEKTQQNRLSKDKTKKGNFTSTYKKFFRTIFDLATYEEKYYNVEIIEDGSIATTTFDYSFWKDNKKINWGKESWGLVKIDGQWKITSIIFSAEFESINPEPIKK
ncbi:Cif family virulence factor [Flavobacterium soyangense]|uniref:Nuclear transport factor 2 family protein n=1 Tax=Flavobacterium soyangense TaxID=2023265 RepID=A0A930UEK2_9FLAO|nr:nuclear transport factor 2 family protein [Flavobacterium soyangense]MBF2709871.1 nuclear transport factor 2 family protein [Flavobacterium soyangense]